MLGSLWSRRHHQLVEGAAVLVGEAVGAAEEPEAAEAAEVAEVAEEAAKRAPRRRLLCATHGARL